MLKVSTKDQMTALDQPKACNSEQSRYRILSYKMSRNHKCKTIQREKKNGRIHVQRMKKKNPNKYVCLL